MGQPLGDFAALWHLFPPSQDRVRRVISVGVDRARDGLGAMPTPVSSLDLLGSLSIAQPAVKCQQPGVSPLAVAGRPSDLWEDYNYKSSLARLLVVIYTTVDRGR